ncbi:dTDP-glucose pyrophosphorylase [Roseivirga ehrenbergii]|nr:dTDP-glucose pyrophosphorylase [Roseivirga ehrenbergii]
MAGKYIRFRNAGYSLPKFLLPLGNGKTIFQEIMEQLVSDYSFENIIIVANKNDYQHITEIKLAIKASGIYEFELLFIEDTKGQAETALIGINKLKKKQCRSKKIVIHNIDTVLYDRDMHQIDKLLDTYRGYIDVFTANTDNYSYVKTDDNNIVTHIKEKEVISSKATTGLYVFKDLNEYEHYFRKIKIDGEYYISHLYELMLIDKKEIIVNTKMAGTIILGTPQEYEQHKNSF